MNYFLLFLVIVLFYLWVNSMAKINNLEEREIWLTGKTANCIDRIADVMLEGEGDPETKRFLKFLDEERNSLIAVRDKDRYNDFKKSLPAKAC